MHPLRLTTRSLLGAALLFSACERQEAKVATQPKDPVEAEAPVPAATPDAHSAPLPAPAQAAPAAPGNAKDGAPHLSWTLPEGWKDDGAGQMSLAHFSVKKEYGEAGISITPMRGMTGKDDTLVNMWRAQAGQPPIEAAEATKELLPAEAAGGPAKLFQVNGTNEGREVAVVTIMATLGDVSWFYKLSGDAAAVVAEKPAFLEFVRTLRIEPPATGPRP